MTDMNYRVVWDDTAKNDIKNITLTVAKTIYSKIQYHLAQEPHGNISKPLRGPYKGIWRYRLGYYRVFYQIDDRNKAINITNIFHRSEAYRF